MQTEPLDLSLQNCPPDDIPKYFTYISVSIPDQLLRLQHNFNTLSKQLHLLQDPIKFIYNPTEYAHIPFAAYIRKYCQTRKKVLVVGMNPGPFGMCQTGIPFGDANWVKNWLGIDGEVFKPDIESPKRPVKGFNSRREMSGHLLWTFWCEVCATADKFFLNSFVINYCPLFFMKEVQNLTPKDLEKICKKSQGQGIQLKELLELCDRLYLDIVQLLQPELVICIGRYVEARSVKLLGGTRRVVYMPHPSPRTPKNQNWLEKARKCFVENNLQTYF